MKHLNFSTKSGSQSGSHRVVTLASTVGSPSAHRRGAMLKLISVLVLMVFGFGQMWGDNYSYTFVNNQTNSNGNKTWNSKSWNLNISGGTVSTFSETQGTHYGTNNNTCNSVTITSSDFSGAISSISVEASRGSSLVGELSVKVNNTAYTLTAGSAALATSNATNTFTGSSSGDIEIKWTKSSGKGALYIKSIAITYTPSGGTPTLKEIAVATAPSKVTYTEGEYFDPTGLVITRTYSSGSPDTYAYDEHESDFSFSPDLSTGLTTTDELVTITYGGKTTSQAITVNEAGGGSGTSAEVSLADGSFSTDHITWTAANGKITITQSKGSTTTAVNSNYISAPRVYKGHILSFEAASGYKITNISLKYDGTNYGNSMTAGTVISNNVVTDNTTDVARTWSTTSGGTHEVSSVSSDGLSAIHIQNVASSANTQLRLTKITITYVESGDAPTCIKTPTVSFATASPEAITAGDTYTNLASVLFESTATGQTITYSSSDGNIASVDASTGEVTAKEVGTVTITATAAASGDYCEASETYSLTINAAPDSKTSKTINLTIDETSVKTEDEIAWSGTYVSVSADKGTTAANNYCPPSQNSTRFYTNSTLTITPVTGYKIDNIVFTAMSDNYATILANSTWTNAVATVGTGDNSKKVTVTASGLGAVSAAIGNTCGFSQIVINYHELKSYAVTVTPPGHGTITVKNGDNTIGATVLEGTTLTVSGESTNVAYRFGTISAYETAEPHTAVAISEGALTMPAYPITITADETALFAVNLTIVEKDKNNNVLNVAKGNTATIDGGEGPVYKASNEKVALAKTIASGYEFEGWTATSGITFDANYTEATITAAGTITATFKEIADPVVTAPASLIFDPVAKKDAVPAAQEITITGQNLTADLTIASSDASLYAVSLKSGSSLTPDANKAVSATIIVTPQSVITNDAGVKTAKVIISGGGLTTNKEVTVSLTVQETYTVNWYVNSDEPAHSQTAVAGTSLTGIPTVTPSGAACEGYTFAGWKEGAIATSQSTAPTYVNLENIVMPEGGADYYAVFVEEVDNSSTVEYSMSITTSDFNGSSYGANDNEKTTQATCTSDNTKHVDVKWTSNTVMLNNNAGTLRIQGKKSEGKIYNEASWGKVKTITINDNENYTSVIGASSEPAVVAEGGYFLISAGSNTSKASSIDIVFEQTEESVAHNYVTTCVACSSVSLVEAGETNGTITLKQGTKAVSSVKTCNGAVILTTNAVANPGYELTKIELSGVANAEISQDFSQVTIPANATGELTVTATFSQKNYEVIVEEYPVIGATLTGATTTAHYNDEITISTNEPAGYKFSGWCMYEVTDTERETDIADEFFTGDYDEYEYATTAKFKMPNRSIVAEANFKKVYSVDEFMDTEFTKTDNKWYYVTGLVAEVPAELYNGSKMTYVISDDATKSGLYLTLYRGLGEDGENFSAVSDLAVGDKVVVYGQWSSSYKNLNEGNYILKDCLTKKALSALAIVGTASVTTYDVGDSFDKTGLSLSATYNTGYVQANYTGTTITSNYDAPTTFTAGVTSVTVSAEEGLISTSRDIAVTVSSAVLDHVEVAASAQTEFWAKEAYKEPLLDAYLTDASVMNNVTGVSNTTGLDMSVAGNKSVTVTYTRKAGQTDDVTYNFTVKPVVVDEAHAHSVATAREIIDVDKTDGEDLDLASEDTKTHVIGVVTSVSALTGANAGKYTIVIKDQTDAAKVMTLYQVTLKSGITSVAQDDIIKAYGNLYYHSQSSKYEINTGGEVVAVVRTPNLTVADVAEMEINVTADLGVDDLTIDKDGSNGDITFSCSDPAVTIVGNKIHAAAEGDATVTATIAATGIYTSAETTFNVHVIAERIRYEITMDANGGTGTDPVYEDQLEGATVNLPATNTYSKANSAFDAWVVTETVSGDAVAVTDGHFTMPAAAVTIQATWNDVETCAISFQVSGAEVATAEAPQTAEFSLASVEHPTVPGFTWVGWSETEYADEVTDLPTTIDSYTPALNEASKTLYGIYSQVVSGANQHYVLDYADENLATNTSWGEYATAYDHTAADGGEWVIKAYKNSGMQINTGKSAYIKVPECAAKIIQISLTCNSDAKKAVKFAETTSGDALAIGTESTSQTLDLSSESVTTGYILPSGNCQITHIDVEYSGSTTYYTSSPVARYNVTYAKGDAENVTGICDAYRHEAGTITLCGTPTCADKTFAKWSDGVNLYNAGAEYTLSADVTFTATWTAKPKYTVTYTANGGTGSAPAVEEYLEGATVTVKANNYFSKPGFSYDGWLIVYNDGVSDHEITPEEGAFTMPAYNVTIKATWAEVLNQKWALVTDASALEAGKKYVIAAAGSNVAMAGQNTNNRSQTTIVKKNEGALMTGTSAMQVITLAGTTGAWEFNTGAGYLYAAGSGKGNNHLRTQETNDANGKWTITISEGVAAITATGTNTNNQLKYNSGSSIFSCYSSGQAGVALYKEIPMTEIDENGKDQDDVPDGGDIIIDENITWTVSSDKEVGDVYMREGAVIANSAEVTANDLYFKTKAGKSNQIYDASKLNVTGLYYDVQLCDGDLNPDYWYSIAVPFDVNLNSGVFQADGTPMENRTNFEVWEYNTNLRAQTQTNGWQRVKDNMMHAGKAYLIGFDPGQPNTIRLKAAEGWKTSLYDPAENENKMSVVSTGGSGDHDNWNGLANPTLRYIDIDKDAQVFNNDSHQFDPFSYDAQEYNFVVGTAFFVQSASAVTISNEDHGQYRAPKRESENKCAYAVRITRDEATRFDNQIIVRASENATGEYTQGHDMLTMNSATSKTAAMLWTENYGGKRLAIEEAAWLNGTASYVLKMFAPAAGTYSISVAEAKANADLYLTYEGNIIWNLSEGAYPVDLKKGNNEGYGLLLNAKAPMSPTGIENTDALNGANSVQKIILDEKVFILRGGKMYDVTGKAVK